MVFNQPKKRIWLYLPNSTGDFKGKIHHGLKFLRINILEEVDFLHSKTDLVQPRGRLLVKAKQYSRRALSGFRARIVYYPSGMTNGRAMDLLEASL